MVPRIIVFAGLATLILFGLHYYIYERLVRYLSLGQNEQRMLKLALCAMFALLWIALPFSRLLRIHATRPLLYASFIWLGVLVMFAVVLLFGDVTRLFLFALHRLKNSPPDPQRRLWLQRVLGVATIGMTGALSGYALWQGMRKVAVKRVQVAIRRLPPALHGFRVAQLTDLHIGPTLSGQWLQQVVEQVNALGADVVAITGDLVDGPVEALRQQIAPLRQLKAPHGVYFVTGNHEYYAGVDEWLTELRSLGIRVLRNERVTVQKGGAALDIAGIDDHHSAVHPGHGPDLPRALAGRDAERPVVLLAHQPIAVEEAAGLDVDLQLSGHTHGGQLWPWGYFVRLQQPYIAGLHRVGKTLLYVSCGTGYWGPPMRLGAPAEITDLTLIG
jgi:predicted MPP superfamily phosphohydrolase